MKTSDIKIYILKTVLENECYGYEIHRRLALEGKEVEVGRLYKILKDMLTEGTLSCRWEKSERGPEKRIYKLAEKGRRQLDQVLLDAIDIIYSYYAEYVFNLSTENNIFEDFTKIFNPESKRHAKIVLCTSCMSFLDEKFLDAIQNDLTESEMYVVRPETEATFNLKNAIYLQGDHKNIPLKAKYIDLLIVEGLPDDQDFSKAINEWLRVLKDNGIVILIAPKSAFSKFKDPLTIGEFMEKIEYKNLSKRKVGNGLAFKQLLEKAFLRVQKREILNMIFLTAVELR